MITEDTRITPEDLKALLLNVYRRYRSGQIDAERARQETFLLKACLDAVTEAELSERLDRIRDVIGRV